MSGRPGVRSVLALCTRRDRTHVPWAYSLVGVTELPVWGPAHPLRREASKWVSWAGAATILLGLSLSQLWREGPPITVTVPDEPRVHITIDNVPAPPSITTPAEPLLRVSDAIAPTVPDFAEPVPVDDTIARQPTIPTTDEIADILNGRGANIGDLGNAVFDAPARAPQPVRTDAREAVPDQLPVRITIVQPEYPAIARSAMVEGAVMLSVKVGKDGTVAEVRVESGPEMLRNAAVRSAWTARFRPAVCNGQAVPAWVRFPIVFQLRAGR
jgi:TonB family protein